MCDFTTVLAVWIVILIVAATTLACIHFTWTLVIHGLPPHPAISTMRTDHLVEAINEWMERHPEKWKESEKKP